MSAPPRFRSVNSGEREFRSILGPTGNKLQRKPPGMKLEKPTMEKKSMESKDEKTKKLDNPDSPTTTLKQCSSLCSSILRRNSASMTASYSSDASSSCESSPLSVASSLSCKKAVRRSGSVSSSVRRKQTDEKEDKVAAAGASSGDCFADGRRRCVWITPTSDPSYVAFHDEEWGVPEHDDKRLFELLCLSGALAELSWTDILSRRQLLREVFMDFDPVAVSELNEKKLMASIALLSEVKIRSILDNSRHVRKIIAEFGSFNKYMWNFVNNKPTQNQIRYQRQVPVKTSKAEFISKDLIRRGFRSVSPTVIYSFMQAAGLTNDHLIGCFRYQDCCVDADTTTTKAKKKNERE
uniref:DNA-3-methyladenine glycosylase 1 n=1 Tax=Noccaea caerulescens TaxID=107243 RepID=A0A1J3ETW3_NOCCA